jgi:hypothetical protein
VTTPTQPIDIEELARLADVSLASWEHSLSGGSWYTVGTLQAAIEDDEDGAYIAAASPQTVLLLLQELRELRAAIPSTTCHDCGAECVDLSANRVLELFGSSEPYVARGRQCVSCQTQWFGADAEIAASEAQYRLAGRALRKAESEVAELRAVKAKVHELVGADIDGSNKVGAIFEIERLTR